MTYFQWKMEIVLHLWRHWSIGESVGRWVASTDGGSLNEWNAECRCYSAVRFLMKFKELWKKWGRISRIPAAGWSGMSEGSFRPTKSFLRTWNDEKEEKGAWWIETVGQIKMVTVSAGLRRESAESPHWRPVQLIMHVACTHNGFPMGFLDASSSFSTKSQGQRERDQIQKGKIPEVIAFQADRQRAGANW